MSGENNTSGPQNSNSDSSGGMKSRRAILVLQFSVIAVFLLGLIGVSVWLVASFVKGGDTKVVVLTPEIAAQAKQITPDRTPAAPRSAAANTSDRPKFAGKVVDAVTKQPVGKFAVRMAHGYQSIFWQIFQDTTPFTGGKYNVSSPAHFPQMYIRIEANGYLPAISPPLANSAEQNFELTPAKDIQGRVLSPDGTPAAKANVVVSLPGLDVIVSGRDKNVNNSNDLFVSTDADGKYDLPPQDGKFFLAAFNDAGYAVLDQDAIAANTEIHLKPYGNLTGKLLLGTQPGYNRQIEAVASPHLDNAGQQPFISYDADARTDKDGNFVINHLPPGPVYINRIMPQKLGQTSIVIKEMMASIDIPSGQTITIKLGGVGRPVEGKLIFSPPIPATRDYFIMASAVGNTLPPPPPQMPENVKNSSALARQTWMGIFAITPAGRTYTASHPQEAVVQHYYQMEVHKDHSFRFDNVMPGDYVTTIRIQFVRPGKWLKPAEVEFTMPPVPGGVSDEPLVIPDITIPGN